MSILWKFFNTQFDENIHQNAPKCTIFSKFSHGSYYMPLNPPPPHMHATIINIIIST